MKPSSTAWSSQAISDAQYAIRAEQPDRLGVELELRPRGHLGQLLERPEATRQRDEPVGQLGHPGLALVERFDDVQLGQPGVGQLAIDEAPRDDPGHLAAGGQRRIGEGAHQPDAAAAVDDPDASFGEPAPDGLGQLAIGRAPAGARATEHADPQSEPELTQLRRQPPGRPRPMRDRVLLGRRPQAQRPATGRLGGRLEDGVVAEPARAARFGGDPAPARPARPHELERASRTRAPSGRATVRTQT